MIAAVVLAAGLSERMGRPKMTLPWGDTTVIGRVVEVLTQAGIDEILVVTGGARELVENVLEGLPARAAHNTNFEIDQMALSLKTGLSALSPKAKAVLVTLGDQPQIEVNTIEILRVAYQSLRPSIVIPSYNMRRGHPWIVDRSLWAEILDLQPSKTLRDFLLVHSDDIYYVEVQNNSILRDLDTETDYTCERPQ